MANISTVTNLIINRLSQSKYEQLCAAGQLDPYQLYMTENSQLDAKNSQIKNVASPLLGTDAANKDYVDNCISNIDIPADLSSFSNSPNYVKQNEIDLSYSNQTLWLSSKSYVTSVDCADFIKDGMLSNVELCDNQLIFEFNTDSGTTPISVALSNFIDETQYWKKSETSSASEISVAIDSAISSSNKIFIKDPSVQEYASGKQSDLSILKVTNEEYAQILQTSADPNVLYVISSNYQDVYGRQLKNLAQGTDLSDAVNVEQLSIAIAYKADISSLSDYALSSDISNILVSKADISSLSAYLPLSGGNVDGSVTFRNLDDGDSITYGSNSIVMNGTSMTIQSDGNSIAVVDTDVTIPFNQILDDSNDGKSLEECLSEKADISSISSYASKVIIDDRVSGISGKNDLSVVKIGAQEYSNLLTGSQLLSNALYIVDDNYLDAYGEQIKNVAAPTDLSDAATKGYVDDAISNVQIPTDLSAFTNSPGYLTEHQSLSGYYQKSETSSAVEINNALTSIDIGNKIFIDDKISSVSGYSDISVVKLDASEYSSLLTSDSLLSNALYIVQDDYMDAYGQQLKNLSAGTMSSDAVTLAQLEGVSASLSGYYQKYETSSASEISIAFDGLSDSYQEKGTYLSSIPNDYKTYDETLSTLSSNGYLMSSDIVSTIGDIQTSLFQNIQNPQASVRSIQDTLISVLNILRKFQEHN